MSRSTARSGVVLLVVGLALLAGTAALVRARGTANEGARRQTAVIARTIEDNVNALKAELIQDVETASDIPQLRSALGNRADALTFLDLFKNEDWWDRYSSRAAASRT